MKIEEPPFFKPAKRHEVTEFFLDMLFPVFCVGCRQPGIWLCAECLDKIPLKIDQFCPICEKITTPKGEACFSCRKKTALDGLLVSSHYKLRIISKLIHLFKYRYVENISGSLGKIMCQACLEFSLPVPDLIIPVPISKNKLRSRGYNQSALLAKYISEHITPGYRIDVSENYLLKKNTYTPQMTIKNYEARMNNVKNSFGINNSAAREKIKNQRILLVDDVATTGATLIECAKVLKHSGAKEVCAIVIARQEMSSL